PPMTGPLTAGTAPGPAGSTSPGPIDLVVDAGLAIKWYVPEVHEAEAKRFLDPAFTLHAPDLFFPEFGNMVWKKARLLQVPEVTEDEGRLILDPFGRTPELFERIAI
ncbi:MAG: type II toxin-antitoxin system VapC family toxin, partial [Planctomycetaceae bacterium]|nr:type II toxin-antitoxin system VapC family toxin [Planctomycetaceae bacterium]